MLTYDEFTKMGFKLDFIKFEELLPFAEIQLNIKVRRYYEFHDLESDLEFRKKAYKRAIAFQIIYMDKQGVSTADDVANKPTAVSQSIGSTSVSKSFGSNSSSGGSNNAETSAVSLEALNQLSGTGLLSRGIYYD
ncbi:hypothetical protein ABRQ21_09700 [Latilactobacillus sakei]|uniref:Uncharacterized protein n=1 Tax=Latilactobacillus sakei TaxID=1599 RepID=A0AAE8LVA8_LATSK|nr:hypothetical protein [Latilactobacillus sakei]AWZ43136.1 hypothetical protein CW750_08465 [Latilactobacillus sakei]SON67263.1 conserved protein of unknown function [Latilactobacillus sakei]SPE18688.1 hypothetical protein LAS9267_00235 [Latilactobacillus sakei]